MHKSEVTPGSRIHSRYKANDGRIINIGACKGSNGGLEFKDPFLDKCWITDGFDFSGFDTLCVAPTLWAGRSVRADEQATLDWTQRTYTTEMGRYMTNKGIFRNVVFSESDIKPGAKALKMVNTMVEFEKGSGAARYFAGPFGAGQPKIRVRGQMTDGDRKVFAYEGQRTGASVAGRLVGGYLKDEDVQADDIRSLATDVTDFVAAIAGKYTAN
jgi:hypothetical protein